MKIIATFVRGIIFFQSKKEEKLLYRTLVQEKFFQK